MGGFFGALLSILCFFCTVGGWRRCSVCCRCLLCVAFVLVVPRGVEGVSFEVHVEFKGQFMILSLQQPLEPPVDLARQGTACSGSRSSSLLPLTPLPKQKIWMNVA